MIERSNRASDQQIADAVQKGVSDLRFTTAMKDAVRGALDKEEAGRFTVNLRRVAVGVAAAAGLAIIANLTLLFATTGQPAPRDAYVAQLPGAAVTYNEEVLK